MPLRSLMLPVDISSLKIQLECLMIRSCMCRIRKTVKEYIFIIKRKKKRERGVVSGGQKIK
jgi:hypothetical protein